MKHLTRCLCLCLSLFACVCADAAQRWLVLGDSITQAGGYVDYLETWMLLNEAQPPEIIDLGLSSETISGLSEPGHPYPRPYIHDRLQRVLERVHPDVVFACYGMNCGIYHPFSEERFAAYREGVMKLIAAVHAAGAEIILLTPPPYAGALQPGRAADPDKPYGYDNPDPDYNSVLARYAEWILSLDGQDGVRALNIRPAVEAHLQASYPGDLVHPGPLGHELMGEALLRELGKQTGSDLLESGINPWAVDPRWSGLLKLVREQREALDRAMLNDLGHGNPDVMKRFTMPLPEAEAKAAALQLQIESLLREPVPPAA